MGDRDPGTWLPPRLCRKLDQNPVSGVSSQWLNVLHPNSFPKAACVFEEGGKMAPSERFVQQIVLREVRSFTHNIYKNELKLSPGPRGVPKLGHSQEERSWEAHPCYLGSGSLVFCGKDAKSIKRKMGNDTTSKFKTFFFFWSVL